MIRKYASTAVLSAEIDANRQTRRSIGLRGPSSGVIHKQAHRANFDHIARKPGFLYVRVRAISSRINENFDEFSPEEIADETPGYGWRTFIGKPVFVNHHNEDHRIARGIVVAGALHEDINPDGTPDTWVELLHEVDAMKFPKLAKAIVEGRSDRTSMGVDVDYSLCSACGNKATNTAEFCFLPGSLVSMADGTFRAIETLEDGDQVLTHDGIGTISAVGELHYNGEAVRIFRTGYNQPVQATTDHNVFMNRVGLDVGWEKVHAGDLHPGQWVRATYPDHEQSFVIDVEALASDLVTIDGRVILATPTTSGIKRRLTTEQVEEIKVARSQGESGSSLARRFGISQSVISNIVHGKIYTDDLPQRIAWTRASLERFLGPSEPLAVLMGYYLAEGSLAARSPQGTYKVVEWSLHGDEDWIADEIEAALQKLDAGELKRYRPSPTKLVVKVSNAPLAELLGYLCGKTTSTTKAQKVLAPEAMLMERVFQEIMLRAYLIGDGTADHYHHGDIANTSSDILARQLVSIGARLDENIPTLYHYDYNSGGPGNRDKRHTHNHVRIGASEMKERRRIGDNQYCAKVTKIERFDYHGPVYTLTVDDQHTYAVEGMVVFNCDHIPARKGVAYRRFNAATGKVDQHKIYEACKKLRFFENSHLVEPPADPTAAVVHVDSSYMLPSDSISDIQNNRTTHAKHGANLRSSKVSSSGSSLANGDHCHQSSDFSDVGISEFGSSVPNTSGLPVSLDHVSGVISVGTEDPVGGVVANGVVTGVSNDLSRSNGANQGFVTPSMGSDTRSFGVVKRQAPVPIVKSTAHPRPTTGGSTSGIDFGEIPLHHGHGSLKSAADHGGDVITDTAAVLHIEHTAARHEADQPYGGGYSFRLTKAKVHVKQKIPTSMREYHRLDAFHDKTQKATGGNAGHAGSILWHHETGEIGTINVHDPHRRKGLATELLSQARQIANEKGLSSPQHSSNRTKMGDAWARSTGDSLPDKMADRARHEAMAWEDYGMDAKKARPISVKKAGFAGFVGTSYDALEAGPKRDFDHEIHKATTPVPTAQEANHAKRHGDFPDSYHDRHAEAYAKAVDAKDDERPDHVDDHLHHWIQEHSGDPTEWTRHSTQPQKINLHQPVYAIQTHVSQTHMDRYHADPQAPSWHAQQYAEDPRYLGERHPLFVTHQGRLHAIEGHHRIGAALQRGDSHIEGWHHDLDAHPHGMTEDYRTKSHIPCEDCQDYHAADQEHAHVGALHEAMAWHDFGMSAEEAHARPVKKAGFAGFVGGGSETEDIEHERPEFDEDLYDSVAPTPNKREQAHYDKHGEHPQSYYDRHDRAYTKAIEKRKAEDQPDHVDEHLHHWIAEHSANNNEWTRHAAQPQQVNLKRPVFATQSHVGQTHIDRYLHNPEDESWHMQKHKHLMNGETPDYFGEKHPLFVTHQGRLHVIEGHHRVAAALQRGDKSIEGWHHDLDAHPVAHDSNWESDKCEDCQYHHDNDQEQHLHAHAGRHHAYNELRAPTEVDTLRQDICPVCGSRDSFQGDRCNECGSIRPPDFAMDPDVEMAKQVDLRQDQGQLNDPMDPSEDPNQGLICPVCGFECENAEVDDESLTPHLAPAGTTIPADPTSASTPGTIVPGAAGGGGTLDDAQFSKLPGAEGEEPPTDESGDEIGSGNSGGNPGGNPDSDDPDDDSVPPAGEEESEDNQEGDGADSGSEADPRSVDVDQYGNFIKGDEEDPTDDSEDDSGGENPFEQDETDPDESSDDSESSENPFADSGADGEGDESEDGAPELDEDGNPVDPNALENDADEAMLEGPSKAGYAPGDECPNCGEGTLVDVSTLGMTDDSEMGQGPGVNTDADTLGPNQAGPMGDGDPNEDPDQVGGLPDADADEDSDEKDDEDGNPFSSQNDDEDSEEPEDDEDGSEDDSDGDDDDDDKPPLKKKTTRSQDTGVASMPNPPRRTASTGQPNPAAQDRKLLHQRITVQANTLKRMDEQLRASHQALNEARATIAQQGAMLQAMAVRQMVAEQQIRKSAEIINLPELTAPLVEIAKQGKAVYDRHMKLAQTAAKRVADIRNPAQPIPEPAPEAPVETEQQAMQPSAMDDPTNMGASPLTDVSADDSVAVDEPYGTTTFEPLQLNEVDVTAPVAGTQEMRPTNETITDVEVRVGNPDDPRPAFGWTIDPGPSMNAPGGTNGPSVGSGAPTTRDAGSLPPSGSIAPPSAPNVRQSNRTMSCIKLARLKIEAGLHEGSISNGDDLVLGAQMEHDASLSDEAIAVQTRTIEDMKRNAMSRQASRPRSAVPQPLNTQASAPSLAGYANTQAPGDAIASRSQFAVTDDEILWWD